MIIDLTKSTTHSHRRIRQAQVKRNLQRTKGQTTAKTCPRSVKGRILAKFRMPQKAKILQLLLISQRTRSKRNSLRWCRRCKTPWLYNKHSFRLQWRRGKANHRSIQGQETWDSWLINRRILITKLKPRLFHQQLSQHQGTTTIRTITQELWWLSQTWGRSLAISNTVNFRTRTKFALLLMIAVKRKIASMSSKTSWLKRPKKKFIHSQLQVNLPTKDLIRVRSMSSDKRLPDK